MQEVKDVINHNIKRCSCCGDKKPLNEYPPSLSGTRYADECIECVNKNAERKQPAKIVGKGKPLFKFPSRKQKPKIKQNHGNNKAKFVKEFVLEDKDMKIEEALDYLPGIKEVIDKKFRASVKDCEGFIFPKYKAGLVLNTLADEGYLTKSKDEQNHKLNIYTLPEVKNKKPKKEYIKKVNKIGKKMIDEVLKDTEIKTPENVQDMIDSTLLLQEGSCSCIPSIQSQVLELLYNTSMKMEVKPEEKYIRAVFPSQDKLMECYNNLPDGLQEKTFNANSNLKQYNMIIKFT
jgi:hypothetical protein